LPITSWDYDGQDESIRHIGPMAQDFYAAFNVGEDDMHITAIDADGVAPAAIEALHEENRMLRKKIAELETLRNAVAPGKTRLFTPSLMSRCDLK